MLQYPPIDPVAFHVFSWPVYWYGLMYLVAFVVCWAVLAWRIHQSPRGFTQNQLSDIVFYAAMGAILGGRLGYILFYDWEVIWRNPLLILQTWKGGMSFHGGLLGVIIALIIYARILKKPTLALVDLVAPAVPLGLAAGRVGNFINSELWGRVTDVPWGMVFPNGGPLPRHPSQWYEFFLEGIILFAILWLYSAKPRPLGAVSGLFALCYGLFRIFVEFFREPDVQIGYIAFGWLTEGQLLSIPLVIVGIILIAWAYCRHPKIEKSHETIS
ncbi:MAG: prolipoprotein diacylglyceryl transferase [Gammaproteobacteria bacterium]|nr:prolipoprotein diacylglyceryl transferase [Gammaproteobacteria bacterium]